MTEFQVVFSLLSGDAEIGHAIQRALPSDVQAFLYTEEQESLLGATDSVEAIASAFREAKVVVILYRAGWSLSRWTRLEAEIIKDRLLDEGSGSLVLVRLDDSDPPAWMPRNNFWVDYVAEGPERTASYVAARVRHLLDPDAFIRATSRTFNRQPVPISRYQLQMQRSMAHYIPVRPEICDACTAAVVFRPFVRVTLHAKDQWPTVTEGLCPRCARDRGIQTKVPDDLDESIFETNPKYAAHLRRILKFPVLQSLSQQPELHSRGVTQVGGSYSATQISFLFENASGRRFDIPFPIWKLEKDDIRSESELIEYAKARILDALDSPESENP